MPNKKTVYNYLDRKNPEFKGGNVRSPLFEDDEDAKKAHNEFREFIKSGSVPYDATEKYYDEQYEKIKTSIEAEQDLITKPYIDDEGKKYKTPEEKQEYHSLLKQKIENLKSLQQDILKEEDLPKRKVRFSGPLGNITTDIDTIKTKVERISELNQQIIELTAKAEDVRKELTPVSDEEMSKVSNAFSITDPDERLKNISALREEMGPRFDRTLKESWLKSYEDKVKKRIGHDIPEDIMSWGYMQFYEGKDKAESEDMLRRVRRDIYDLNNQSGIMSHRHYKEADYVKKRIEIIKKADEYANEGTNADGTALSKTEKDKRKSDYLRHALLAFAHNSEGKLTIEGTKLMTEEQKNIAQTMINAYNAEILQLEAFKQYKDLRKEGTPDKFQITRHRDPTGDLMGRMNQMIEAGKDMPKEWDEYYQYLKSEVRLLSSAIEKYDIILKMPEIRGGISDLLKPFKGEGGVDKGDIASIGLKSLFETLELKEISDKLTDGEELTLAEEHYLKTFATLNFINSDYDVQGIWYNAQKGAINMVPYIASFVLTSGPYSLVRKGMYEGIKAGAVKGLGQPMVNRMVTRSTVRAFSRTWNLADIAAKNVARVSGSAFQTMFNPQMYLKEIAREMAGTSQIDYDENLRIIATLDENTKAERGSAIYKGMIDTFGEIMFERTGGYLFKFATLNYAGKAVGGTAWGKRAMQSEVIKRLSQLKGYTTVTKMNEEIIKKKLGWHGVFGEYLEELATHYFVSGMTGEELHPPDFRRQQLETFLTVALFGGFTKASKYTTEKIIGTDVRFDWIEYEDKIVKKDGFLTVEKSREGVEKSIKLPLSIYNALNKLFEGNKLIDGDAIHKFIEDNKGKLTKDQIALIIDLSAINGRKKAENLAYDKAQIGEKKEESVANLITTATQPGKPDIQDTLTPEDRKTVTEENVKIVNENKELADLDLLLVDEVTGQYIPPTKVSVEAQLRSVNDQIANTDFSRGDAKIADNPDHMLLLKRKAALESKLQEFIKESKVQWDDKTHQQKNETLTQELKEGKSIRGKVSKGYGGKTGLLITLGDGRVVQGYIKRNLDKNDQKALAEGIFNDKEFELEYESWETWNKNREIKDERGLPYEGRININVVSNKGEITTVGVVRVTEDFTGKKKAEAAQKIKEDKAEEKAVEALETSIKKYGLQAPLRRKYVVQKPVEDVDMEREEDIEAKKAEIERRRHEELFDNKKALRFASVGDVLYDDEGNKYTVLSKKDKYGRSLEYAINDKPTGSFNPKTVSKYHWANEDMYYKPENEINAKYDAELAALEKPIDPTAQAEGTRQPVTAQYYEDNFGMEHIETKDMLEAFMQRNGIEYEVKYRFTDINDKLIDRKRDPFTYQILSSLSEYIDIMQTDVIFVNRYRFNKYGEHEGVAEYDHVNDQIVIYIPALTQKYVLNKYMEQDKLTVKGKTHIVGIKSPEHMLQKVWGHEVIHAFTLGKLIQFEAERVNSPLWNALSRNKNLHLRPWEKRAIENIDLIYQYVLKNNPELTGEYALNNLREFVAEAGSNAGFAAKLLNIKLPDNLQYKPHTPNVFHTIAEIIKDFINEFMKLLGMPDKSANNAFNALMSFINDMGTTYSSAEHYLSSVTFAQYFELEKDIERSSMMADDSYASEESRKNIQSSLFNAIDVYTKHSDMSAANTIPLIKKWVKQSGSLSDYEIAIWNMAIDRNADVIIKYAITKTMARQGLIKKEKIIEPGQLDIPDLDMFVMTGKQKVEAITGVLARFWEAIAQKTEKSKDTVEHTFYKLALEPGFKEMVTDDATFKEYLNSIRGRDEITEAFIDIFSRSKLDDVLGLYVFYGNLRLTRHYGFTIDKDGITFDLLNPSEKYNDFLDRALTFIDKQGADEIRHKILRHNSKRNSRFMVESGSYGKYQSLPSEQRYQLRLEQHEEDLLFLEEVTGIGKDLWRQYFVKRTKETEALSSREASKVAQFGTYDNLLKYDTFRQGAKGIYHRVQSNLMFQLSLLPAKEDFSSALIKFFTEGDMDKVYSNLYKLATAITDRHDIGLSGIDVKGDRFTSFLQTSHMQKSAERIHEFGLDNVVTRFYAEENRVPEIIVFNGIRDESVVGERESIEGENIGSRDFWKSLLWMFMKGNDITNSDTKRSTYLQWLGQFGDKSSIALTEVPKHQPTKEELEKKKEEYKDFQEISEWLFTEQLFNQSSFKDYTNNDHDKLKELIDNYIYNFIENINALNEIFHGDTNSYESLTDLVKRAATTNSPGYTPATNIAGGVGSTFRAAIVEDTFGVFKKLFDGQELMLNEYAAKLQVSMGSMFSKKQRYPVLSGVKGLTSFTDPTTNLRGLNKVNVVNIDVYCDSHPEGSIYHQIRKVMKQLGIDRLGFTSGNKKIESSYGKAVVIDLFEVQDGKVRVKKDVVIPKDKDGKVIGTFDRKHDDFFIQQDLRHETKPTEGKMSSQLLSNVLHLPHGHKISELHNRIQQTAINDLLNKLNSEDLLENKLKWLREKVDPYTQKDIAELLDAGMTLHDPFLRVYLNRILASAFTHKALEIPVQRIATQEIADAAGMLKGRRPSPSNPKYMLLPDIATTVDGGRYSDDQFVKQAKGNAKKAIGLAIAHIKRNKNKYKDLYDENGMLMEHEIIDRDGVIPGEIVISVRTPNDDLHSMTVGRLAFPLAHGNFTMLDRESQEISGSDFDGDQRFNIVLYKDKGNISLDNTRSGLVNQMIMAIDYDYVNPKVDARIKAPIDVKLYDGLLEEMKKGEKDYSKQFDNILGFDKARNENLVGVKMKGKLTNLNTVLKLILGKKIKFKTPVVLSIGEKIDESYDIEELENASEFNKLPSKSSTPTMTYAGIGSRNTPIDVKKQMTEIAGMLESKGYTLNTGVTFGGKKEGADEAFNNGTNKKYLASPENQGSRSIEQAIAKELHPNPSALKPGGLKLMARNTNQVFGDKLDTPVDFVLFWAKETSNPLRPEGGTGQAVEMARRKGIPTINMANENWREQLNDVLEGKEKKEGIKEYTPENITSLKPNEIFVFGSNTTGKHGLGAAKTAIDHFGAIYGKPQGIQGQSYAIITKDLSIGKKSIPLEYIGEQLADFFEYANNHPELKFYVTKLGSSLAGYTVDEIKSVIKKVNDVNGGNFIGENVILPKEYEVRKDVSEEQNMSLKLGKQTQSRNVVLPQDLGGKAKDIFGVMSKFKSKYPNGIIAYRVNKSKPLIQNLKEQNAIGNPFDWNKYGVGKATEMFMNWMINGNNYNEILATEEYRIACIEKIKNSKNEKILYYNEFNTPTHATILDYLINEYDWNKKEETELLQPKVPKVNDIVTLEFYFEKEDKIIPVKVRIKRIKETQSESRIVDEKGNILSVTKGPIEYDVDLEKLDGSRTYGVMVGTNGYITQFSGKNNKLRIGTDNYIPEFDFTKEKNITSEIIEDKPSQPLVSITLSEVSNDQYDMMSMHVSNILNMAFDNAADPRIERMGLNEHTADMWITALISNPKLHGYNFKNAKEHNDAIIEYVGELMKYFRSSMLDEFTELMRNGYEVKNIKEQLLATYDQASVETLINFYYSSQDFSRLRKVFAITQKMPDTTADLFNAQLDYQALKDNKFDLIDTRSFFDNNGNISNEFKIIESVFDIAENVILNDSFENTSVGKEIINAITLQLKDKKGRIKKGLLESVIYGLNNVAAIRAMNIGVSIPILKQSLISQFVNLRKQFPDNKFLHNISVMKGNRLEISMEFKWAKYNEQTLTDIKKDFDALPDDVKQEFAMYALANWGVSTSSFKGSYAKLIGTEYRVHISEQLSNEFYKWQRGDLTSAEKYQIMQTVLRGSKNADVREKAEVNERFTGAYEYNILADREREDTHISLDSLEGIDKADFKVYEEFVDFAKKQKFDPEIFKYYAEKTLGKSPILSFAGKLLKEFKDKAAKTFPDNAPTKNEVKDMLSIDAVGEALASEDPALEQFIFEHLKKMYPTVQFFTDKQAFYDFVMANGGRMKEVNMTAIGHAFKNAVFIDTDMAVQSTTIHEHAHIYWDALPYDNNAKNKLRLVVAEKSGYDFDTLEELDEFIINQIGKAGLGIANTELNEGMWGEFLNALKEFWIEIKKLIGLATTNDLVFSMAYSIWNNRANIKPQTVEGRAAIRNMVSYDQQTYNDYRNAKENKEMFSINGIPVHGPTRIISRIAPEIFNAEKLAAESAGRWDFMRRAITNRKLSAEELNAENKRLTELWRANTETGTIMHSVLQYIADEGNPNPFPKPNINPDNVTTWFENWDSYSQFFTAADAYIRNLKETYPDAIFHTEKLFISKKFGIGGYADLVLELLNNELIIIDFKSTDKEFVDASPEAELRAHYKQSYGKMAAPFRFNNSKFNKNSLQLNMYGIMAEEQEDIDNPGVQNTVKQLRIVPIVREVNKEGKIVSASIGRTVIIPRSGNFKTNAENLMLHHSIIAKSVNESSAYKDALELSGIAPQVIDSMVEAFKYMASTFGDNKDFQRAFAADLRKTMDGHRKMMENQANLGYTKEDLKRMPMEHIFFIAFNHNTNDKVTKNDYEEMKDDLFPEFEVGKRFKSVANPEKPKRVWSHLTHEGNDLYLQEVGSNNLEEGDEIAMIYDMPDVIGQPRREIYFYQVIDIDMKNNMVTVADSETGEINHLKGYFPGQGFYKIHDVMPEGFKVPEKNSFIPRRIYEVEVIKERHYKDFLTEEQYNDKFSDGKYRSYQNSIRKIWKFFKKYNNLEKFEEFIEKPHDVAEALQRFNTVNAETLGRLGLMLQDENVNHWIAEQLRREHGQYDKSPSEPLPFTYLFYQMFAAGRDLNTFFTGDFKSFSGIFGWLPPEFLDVDNTAISTFYQSIWDNFSSYTEYKFELEQDFKKYADKVDTDMITTVTKHGVYWLMPSEVPIGTLEREYLDKIYAYHIQYNSVIREQHEEGVLERIPVSQVFMTYQEFSDRYGEWGRRMYLKLRPSEFDHVRLQTKDGIRTLREIKDQFIFEEATPDQRKDFFGAEYQMMMPGTSKAIFSPIGKVGQLDAYIKKAQNIYKTKEGDPFNNANYLEKKRRSMKVVGKGKIKYSTSDYVRAEEKAIESHMYKHYLGQHEGVSDWFYQLYSTNNENKTNRIQEYLRDFGDYILYGITKTNKADVKWQELVNAFVVLNSRNKIAFSVRTQFINLTIGQTMDLIMEPHAYVNGWKRLAIKDSHGVWGYQKAFKVLKRHGLADIINDHEYKKLDEQMRVLGVTGEEIVNWGYWLMSTAEELNQFAVFVGLMTQEEWDSYDSNGNPTNNTTKLSFYRKWQIATRVKGIHGMYSKLSTAPQWTGLLGKPLVQFRKWMFPLIWNQVAPYYIDQNFYVKSGIIPSIKTVSNIVRYNMSSTAKKQETLRKAIERQFEKAELNRKATNIRNTRDHIDMQLLYANGMKDVSKYMKVLTEELNAGRVTWKQMSVNDKRNMYIAARFLATYLTYATVMMFLMFKEEERAYLKANARTFIPFFARFTSDVLWIYNPSNYEEIMENPVPLLSIVTGFLNFAGHVIDFNNQKYEQDTVHGLQGMPKAFTSWTKFTPYGSAMRQVWQFGLKQRSKIKKAEIYKHLDLFPSATQDFLIEGQFSEWEMREFAYRARNILAMQRKGAISLGLDEKGISKEDYAKISEYSNREKKMFNQFKDLSYYVSLIEQQGVDPREFANVLKEGAELKKEEDRARKTSRKKLNKEVLDLLNK